jgi:hypothetical protein
MKTHQPEKPSWMEQFLEKTIMILNKDDTRKRLQIYLLDPLLTHILERVFPYIVLTCVLFSLLLIVAILTFGMLLVQSRSSLLPWITVAAGAASPGIGTTHL